MNVKQEIVIKTHRKGKSQRCREPQISRKTVRKYITEYRVARLEL